MRASVKYLTPKVYMSPAYLVFNTNIKKLWSLATKYKNNMMFILNLKDPPLFLIQYIFCLYQGLNWGPSVPEADYIPMCHYASQLIQN